MYSAAARNLIWFIIMESSGYIKEPRGSLMWMKKHNPKDIKKDNLAMRGCEKKTRILTFVSWAPKRSHLIIGKFEVSST